MEQRPCRRQGFRSMCVMGRASPTKLFQGGRARVHYSEITIDTRERHNGSVTGQRIRHRLQRISINRAD